MKAIGIIHAYPGKEILQALNEYEIHLFVPNGYGIKTDNERNAYIHEVELSETDECVNIIFEVVKTYDIEMFLPLYEGGDSSVCNGFHKSKFEFLFNSYRIGK